MVETKMLRMPKFLNSTAVCRAVEQIQKDLRAGFYCNELQ